MILYMVLERLVAWSMPSQNSTWTLRWEALFLQKSSTEPTSHLGSTGCTNTLLAKAIGVMLKEQTKINPTQHMPIIQLGASNEPCVVMPCIMRPWSHARLHSRGQNAKRGMGEPQEDICGEHNRRKASTPTRVEPRLLGTLGTIWIPYVYNVLIRV